MRECVKIARMVMDHDRFSYLTPRGMMIAKCARYMWEICENRHITDPFPYLHLRYVAKHFYISEINAEYNYKYAHKSVWPTQKSKTTFPSSHAL